MDCYLLSAVFCLSGNHRHIVSERRKDCRNMADEVKSILVESLEAANKDGTSMKEFLADCLLSSFGKATMDESIFKRKRGRPRKDENQLSDLPEERHARAALLEEKKAQARMRDRVNPGATKEERQKIEYNAELREIGWDLEECPGKDSEFVEMEEDLKSLRDEAGNPSEPFGEEEGFKKASKEFKDLKEEVVLYYGKAKEYLGKNDFRRVEEMVSYLKPKPRELTQKFEMVEKAYDALCEALCAMADADGSGRGAANPDSLEVEKKGFGMMDGEDYSEYAKRMKSIGLGKEIPKTIRDIDNIVENTERRWRSVAGISISDFKTIKENWQKTIRRLLGKSFISSNLKIDGVNRILSYGLDFGDYDVGYGILQPMNPFMASVTMGGQYGEIIVKWKPYKVVSTMSFADSISMGRGGYNFVCASFLTCPSPCSFNPESKTLLNRLRHEVMDASIEELCDMTDMPYCELQLHGDTEDYNAEAIESIMFSSEYEVCNLTSEALKAISENGITIFIKGEQISIEDGKIVKSSEKGGQK